MGPALLIADEPHAGPGRTVQASILRLLLRLRAEMGLAPPITHDLGIVAEVCDRVYVMYAARGGETNAVEGLFARPRHPYTQGLRGTLAVEAYAGELFSVPGTPTCAGPRRGAASTPAVPWRRRGSAGSRCAPDGPRGGAQTPAGGPWSGGPHLGRPGGRRGRDRLEIGAEEGAGAPDAPDTRNTPDTGSRRDLRKHFRVGGDCSDRARSCGRWTASPWTWRRGRRWPWWGSPSPPWGGLLLGLTEPTGARCAAGTPCVAAGPRLAALPARGAGGVPGQRGRLNPRRTVGPASRCPSATAWA